MILSEAVALLIHGYIQFLPRECGMSGLKSSIWIGN